MRSSLSICKLKNAPPLWAKHKFKQKVPHPMRGLSAGDHFSIGVPFGRPINPVTHGDWEGKGVEPDVKVSATDALTTAQKLAADKLATKDKPTTGR